jgi:hypothetical protein
MASCQADRRALSDTASFVAIPELTSVYGFMSHPSFLAARVRHVFDNYQAGRFVELPVHLTARDVRTIDRDRHRQAPIPVHPSNGEALRPTRESRCARPVADPTDGQDGRYRRREASARTATTAKGGGPCDSRRRHRRDRGGH